MLAHWPEHPSVALVTTDGFLYPNAELERRGHPAPQGLPGVLRPQGAAAVRHRHQVRQGRGRRADVLPPDLRRHPRRAGRRASGPDIVVIEGLNVLQPARARDDGRTGLAVSDFFDFSVYVDAAHRRHPALVHRALPAAARDGVPRPDVVLPPVRRPHRGRGGGRGRAGSGTRSTGPTSPRTSLPTRARATLVLRKAGTTRSAGSGCARSGARRVTAASGTAPPRAVGTKPSASLTAIMWSLTSALKVSTSVDVRASAPGAGGGWRP